MAADIVDFSTKFYATEKSVFQYHTVHNKWKNSIEVSFRLFKTLETNSIVQVSDNGAILAQNGSFYLESGK